MRTIPRQLAELAQRCGPAGAAALEQSPEGLLATLVAIDPARLARGEDAAAFVREGLAFLGEEGFPDAEAVDLPALLALGRRLADALAAGDAPRRELAPAAWAWLDLVRRRPVVQRIAGAGQVDESLELVLELVRVSRFDLWRLLAQRADDYGARTLFRVPSRGESGQYSWLEVVTSVERIARGLLRLRDERGAQPVAIISTNSYEMALFDLACLTTGIVNVMIPPGSTDRDVTYVLERTGAGTLAVSGDQLQRRALRIAGPLPGVKTIVRLDDAPAHEHVMPLGQLIAGGARVPQGRLEEAREAIDFDAVASIMVTSGTTGRPKSIQFTQLNLISKRFARGMALPEIGDRDVFLSYLPLYHTFGRYLEMLGCVFWGATYVFLEDPSVERMLDLFSEFRPTVFISIPKKWIQLYEEIARRVDLELDPDEVLERAARQVVGPRLRWGLSAAGFLDPEIFQFFQRQGVELMSGFGMTEATGGITMTPPGRYREDTLGLPLPGIEVRLADDGEMLIRGPYVMVGYLEEEDERDAYVDGWLRTGDLMTQDEAGFYRILDRKKEIYKNVKGQTVAPQRIENLFRDFDAVHRVFLVGDHREYNTALIVPNPAAEQEQINGVSAEARRDYYRSLVVSVNSFLSPYERIVDFALLDRDFDAERGELTPKNTYRRRQIADNFADVIDQLYRQVQLRLPGREIDIKLPNRLFQVLGVTARDIHLREGRLVIEPSGTSLHCHEVGTDGEALLVRIGSYIYRVARTSIDLGQMLTCPPLWLGNEELTAFSPMETTARLRRRHPPAGLSLVRRAEPARLDPADAAALREAAQEHRIGIDELDLAARALHGEAVDLAFSAIELLSTTFPSEETRLLAMAHLALRSAAEAPSLQVRRRAFSALLPLEEDARAPSTIARFLERPDELLDEPTIRLLSRRSLSDTVLQALAAYTCRVIGQRDETLDTPAWRRRVSPLLRLLGRYGSEHPVSYRALRRDLARLEAFTDDAIVREEAAAARSQLTAGFRRWLGPTQWMAVDSEAGGEYRWEDVLTFEEETPEEDRLRITDAIRSTPMLREAIFLLHGGQTVRLSDIPPQGVWISLLRRESDRVTYHAVVHTRFQGAFDFGIGLSDGLSPERIEQEVGWATVAGEGRRRRRLVEEMGGCWADRGFWTKEFLQGETIERALTRLARRRLDDGVDRLRPMWPFMVWSAAQALFDFWERTGRRYVLGNASADNVIVPSHDYQVGARLVSVASRQPSPGAAAYARQIWEQLVEPIEREHQELAGVAGCELILSALLEAVGPDAGLHLLRTIAIDDPALRDASERFRAEVEQRGFVPRRLYFAIARYRRWRELAPEATSRATAQTLKDIYVTYNLAGLASRYPEARVRFFRETVFADAPREITEGLDDIIHELRSRKIDNEELLDMITALARRGEPGSDIEFFFARLTFPHLAPSDRAGFVSADWGSGRQADVVVTLRDNLGRPFRVRQPVSPKEVGRLHRLFLAAKMEVSFSPEHEFLIAVNERGHLVGGLFYDVGEEASGRAHLEKIVVAERYRKLGVADGLMKEFVNRLAAQGFQLVTTGFYRPSYFYRHGFRVERRYAGLARPLAPEGVEDEPAV
jgi:long-subunit acyl-CoA synthetase (AMP-forming)/GNAT superfamily N-acetyltransferase